MPWDGLHKLHSAASSDTALYLSASFLDEFMSARTPIGRQIKISLLETMRVTTSKWASTYSQVANPSAETLMGRGQK